MDGCFPGALAFAIEAMVRVEGKRDCGETGRAKYCGAVRWWYSAGHEKKPHREMFITHNCIIVTGRARPDGPDWLVGGAVPGVVAVLCLSISPGRPSLGFAWARGDEPLVVRLLS